MSLLILIIQIVLAQNPVIVRDAEGNLLFGARVEVRAPNVEDPVFTETTDRQGTVTIPPSPQFTGKHRIRVSAEGHKLGGRNWPFGILPNEPIEFDLEQKLAATAGEGQKYLTDNGMCFTQRFVNETVPRADGTAAMITRSVLEPAACEDMANCLQIKNPKGILPPGLKYQLSWVEVWFDPIRNGMVHKGHFRRVPINGTGTTICEPCRCCW